MKYLLRGSHCGWIVIAVAAVAFYVLNLLSAEYHDDFIYKFMIVDGAVDYTKPVGNLADVFRSQVEHYVAVNGRSVVHCLVQVFTGLLGKQLFNVCNALVFALFIWLLQRQVKLRDGAGCLLACTLSLALVLLLPNFNDTFLWMTGSVNYLWSATAAVAFLTIHEQRRYQPVDRGFALLLPAAFLMGWTHEGIALPLALSLVACDLMRAKRGQHGQGIWVALVFLAGACMTMFSPGALDRSAATGVTATAAGLKLLNGFTVMARIRVIYVALALTVVLWFTSRDVVRRVVRDNVHLLLAALLSLGIVFVAGQSSPRTAFGLELFSLLYILRLVGEWMPQQSGRAVKWSGITLATLLIAFYIPLLYHTVATWHETGRLITGIERSPDGIVGTREHQAGLFNPFIRTMISRDAGANAVNFDPHGWPASMAATYGRDSLVFLPQDFLDQVRLHGSAGEAASVADGQWEFYVRPLGNSDVVDRVQLLLAPFDFDRLPFFYRPIARRMNRYTATAVTTYKWATVDLYGRRYLLVKRDRDLDGRLRELEYSLKQP